MKNYLIVFSIWLFCVLSIASCGVFVQEPAPTRIIVERKPSDTPKPSGPTEITAYSFDELVKTCTGCHNNSAPFIPLTEDEFRNSPKVKNRTLDGSMPPAGGLNLERAKKFFEG